MLAVNRSSTTLVAKLGTVSSMPAFPFHHHSFRQYSTTEDQPVLSMPLVNNHSFPVSVFEDNDEIDAIPGEASDDDEYIDGDTGVGSNGNTTSTATDYWTPLPVHGVLSKWTNLLHGWQERYFVLADGLLTYYRNADEVSLGSRGSIRIRLAEVKTHEYDECRFEVRVGESIWYLRGVSTVQRQTWISAIERHRLAESGYVSERTLNRPTSMLSLNSSSAAQSPSLASSSSFKRGHRLLEKLAEMTTFKELLCKQVDTLQAYFDACSSILQQPRRDAPDGLGKWSDLIGHVDEDAEATDKADDAVRVDGDRFNRTVFLHLHKNPQTNPITKFSNQLNSVTEDTGAVSRNDLQSLTDDFDRVVKVPQCHTTTSSSGFFSRFLPFRSGHTANTSVTTTPVAPRKSTSSAVKGDSCPTGDSAPRTSPTSTQLHHLWKIITQHAAMTVDFRGEGHMFKATTAGILTNLSYAIELMQCREDQWRRHMKREIERYRRLEEQHRGLTQELLHLRQLVGLNGATINSASAGISLNGISAPPQSPSGTGFPSKTEERQFPKQCTRQHTYNIAGPDYQEGPNSPIREEEFYDAIDAELDKIEQDQVRLEALKSVGKLLRSAQAMPSTHPLHEELEKCVTYRLRNFANSDAFLPPGDRRPPRTVNDCTDDHVTRTPDNAETHDGPEINLDPVDLGCSSSEDWQVITQDGDLIIYQREMETDDGVVLDPLQAVHRVPCVTAREMCTYFWDVQYRMDWEITIDQAPTVLEVCGDDTVVLHQLYKRVWPTTQRDAVYWSHIRQVSTRFPPTFSVVTNGVSRTHQRSFSMGYQYPALRSPNAHSDFFENAVGGVNVTPRYPSLNATDSDGVLDSWMVVNMSTDYRAECVPVSASPIIRLGLDVILYCQTVLSPPSFPGGTLSRNQLSTRLVYMANINPGGWVPATGLRTLARREYPRFLKRFSAYVQQGTKDKIPLF